MDQARSQRAARRRKAAGLYRPHLTDAQLDALHDYKYRGEDRSIVYKYVLAPWYNQLVEYIPLWVAPNTLTFLGFLLPTLTHATLVYFSPTMEDAAPRMVHAVAAVTLFAYMVLDNLDGKQARRTRTSSPLGQLFDHGCDALNVTVSGISLLVAVRYTLPMTPVLVVHALGHLMFYGAAIEEFETGIMILRELNGPTEGLLTLCGVQALTAILGPQSWGRSPWPGVLPNGRTILAWMAIAPTLHTLGCNVWETVRSLRRRSAEDERACDKGMWTGALQILWTRSWPALGSLAMQTTTTLVAPVESRRVLVSLLWVMGLTTYDGVTRIMLATLTKTAFPRPSPLLPLLAATHAAVLCDGLCGTDVSVGIVSMGLLVAGGYSLWRTWCIVSQLCDELNIRCFSVRPLRKS